MEKYRKSDIFPIILSGKLELQPKMADSMKWAVFFWHPCCHDAALTETDLYQSITEDRDIVSYMDCIFNLEL